MKNGKAEMAYVGATPWHGLGQRLEAGASIDTWAEAAGMDWRIQRSVVRFATERGAYLTSHYVTMDDKHVLLRSDTKQPLSVVSDKYQVVQPRQVLEFFRDLTDTAGFVLDTAGTLFGGRKFWAMANVGAEASIGDPKDKVLGRLLCSTSCDGSAATEARFVCERVVCNNTLQVALAESQGSKVRVTHRSVFRADEVKKELKIELLERFDAFIAEMRALAATPLSVAEARLATAVLVEPKALELEPEALAKLTAKRQVQEIDYLADGQAIGSSLDGAQGTAWGWLNAVTEHVDHRARARVQDNRLDSAWFGRGDALKSRALAMLQDDRTMDAIRERALA